MKIKKTLAALFFAFCQFMAISQNPTCSTATKVWLNCNDSIISNYSASNGEIGPNYGCLATNPNPNWNYFKVNQVGTINVIISQVNNSLTATDVDFICWGPFSNTNFCSSLTSSNTAGCSYSPASAETMSFTASLGYYVFMTTNYSGTVGKTILHPNTGSAIIETMSISPVNPICMGNSTIISTSGASTYTWNTSQTSSSISVSPTSTTSYSVYGTQGMCSANISTVVTVNSTPIVTVNNSTICAGATANLIASGASTYLWNTGASTSSIFVNPVVNTTYTVTGTTAGCTSSAVATVIINPSPIVAVNSASVCNGQSVALTSSGAATYMWNTGGSTASIIVTPTSTTSYTVTGTTAGCTASAVATVIVSPNPTANATSNSPICSGDMIVFTDLSTITSGVISNRTWSGPNSFSSTSTNPNISNSTLLMSGNYTLTVISNSSCTNTFSFPVTVNPLPIITISTSTSVLCSNTSATLTAAGANIYSWNTSDVTATIVITPTISSNYTVTGTNTSGCVNNATIAISVISSKTISGSVTNTLGVASGNMVLYKYSSALSKWDSIAFTPFTSTYSFGPIDSSLYVVKAIPTATNMQVTYGTSSISWQGATVVTHGCNTNTSHNIAIIPLTNIGTGTGSINGIVTEAQGFGHRMSSEFKPTIPGTPIGGIIVKGGKNPGGQMFVQTVTAADGTYTLSGIPDNSPTDNYFILVDIAGLDTNGTYHVSLSAGNNQLSGLNFTVDSIYVNPTNNAVTIHDITAIENQIKIFPNPTSNKVTIQYSLQTSSSVKIELFDILGKSIKTILPETDQSMSEHSYTIQLNDITAGMYFMKVKINNSESVIKLFVSN